MFNKPMNSLRRLNTYLGSRKMLCPARCLTINIPPAEQACGSRAFHGAFMKTQ